MEAEQEDERVAFDVHELAGGCVLHGHRFDRAVTPDLAYFGGDADAHLALLLEPAGLFYRRLERPKAVAPVDEGNRKLCGVLQSQRPVEGRVPAAHDHARFAGEDLFTPDEVMETSALPVVDSLERELPRLEGTVPGGDDEGAREESPARLRPQGEHLLAVLADPREIGHLLVEVDVGAELEALLDAQIDELLAEDLRMPGHVVDVLLRVDRGYLAAELPEALDDPHRRVAVPRVVRSGEANGSRSCRPRAPQPRKSLRRLPSPGRKSRSHRQPARSGC